MKLNKKSLDVVHRDRTDSECFISIIEGFSFHLRKISLLSQSYRFHHTITWRVSSGKSARITSWAVSTPWLGGNHPPSWFHSVWYNECNDGLMIPKGLWVFVNPSWRLYIELPESVIQEKMKGQTLLDCLADAGPALVRLGLRPTVRCGPCFPTASLTRVWPGDDGDGAGFSSGGPAASKTGWERCGNYRYPLQKLWQCLGSQTPWGVELHQHLEYSYSLRETHQ